MISSTREPFCFLFACSEVNSTLLITSELTNQNTRNVLFASVVYIDCCFVYLHKITSYKCSASSSSCLAVNIHTIFIQIHLFNKLHPSLKHLLGWCIIEIYCGQLKLGDTPLRPFLLKNKNVNLTQECILTKFHPI